MSRILNYGIGRDFGNRRSSNTVLENFDFLGRRHFFIGSKRKHIPRRDKIASNSYRAFLANIDRHFFTLRWQTLGAGMSHAPFIHRTHCLFMISRSDVSSQTENCLHGIRHDERSDPVRIWIVDNAREYRSLLAELLSQEEDLQCERQFESAEAVIEALTRENPPNVILLDIEMGGMSGLEALWPIKAIAASVRVLMLTSIFDMERKRAALRRGASDFLLKRFTVDIIAERIRLAHRQPVCGCLGPDVSAGEPSSVDEENRNSEWLERRLPGTSTRHSGDDISRASSSSGHRTVRWRSASRGLARGVHYIRTLMRMIF